MLTRLTTYFATFTRSSKVLLIGYFTAAVFWTASFFGIGSQLPFQNPALECPVVANTRLDDPVYQETEQRSLADLNLFCSTILQQFRASSLTRAEAAELQQIFQNLRDTSTDSVSASADERLLHFTDDYYPVGPRLFDNRTFRIPQRVLLKKRAPQVYEIFYYSIECGVAYRYQEVQIEKQNIVHVRTIATWETHSPC